MPKEIHIASLVVHGRPEALVDIGAGLAELAGVEIHTTSPEGKLVVTLETESEGEIVQCLDQINNLRGVLAATLVFHHCEPASEPSQPPG